MYISQHIDKYMETLLMAIEFFTKSGRGYEPKASIRRHGQIGLNQGAVERFGLADYSYVLLGYDRARQLVAIKLLEQEEKGAKKIALKQGSASISAKSFLDFFGINYKKTASYDVERDDQSDCLVFHPGIPERKGGDFLSTET